jgi:putative DNA methylase
MPSSEIVTRGNLPHWFVHGAAHFVTYRLAGTLPAEVMQSMRERKRSLLARPLVDGQTPAQRREIAHKLLFADYDSYLDRQRGIDWLIRPTVASMIRRNLYHHNGSKFRLLSYCVMPNHVHVLLIPIEKDADARGAVGADAGSVGYVDNDIGERADSGSRLSAIMHSLKSYTANEANKLLGRTDAFWQRESYDHWVRDDAELERIVAYIIANPVKAGLAKSPHEWLWGSAHDRYLHDGDQSGYLGDLS